MEDARFLSILNAVMYDAGCNIAAAAKYYRAVSRECLAGNNAFLSSGEAVSAMIVTTSTPEKTR